MSHPLRVSEPADHVMLLTLNRPEARNAIDLALVDALTVALDDFRNGERWRCAIITGAPPAFCAGLDLKSFSAPDAPRHRVTEIVTALPRLNKPIIAAVNGAAYTGGLEIVLSCDFAIASGTARFADTHARIGALSGSGMGSRLPHAVGARWAKQMMLTSAAINAQTALAIGLVNEVVEAEQCVPRAVELAALIAGHDPELIAITRGIINRGSEATLAEAIEIERRALAERKQQGAMQWRT